MLSICIPVYNHYVYPLVKMLNEQIKKSNEQIDIWLIDDCSQEEYSQKNYEACQLMAHYIFLPENVGRSKIRNLFPKYTKSPFLLYLDCDVAVDNPHFIKNYIDLIKSREISVVTGGHKYPDSFPGRKYAMRWKFGQKRESLPATERNRSPYKSFKTSNFLVSQNVFSKVRFNEGLSGYGHEDTLFGFDLKAQKIPILHVDNPVLIKKIDSNRLFLEKTNRSIQNLLSAKEITGNETAFIKDISLLRAHARLKQKKGVGLFRFMYKVSSPLLELLIRSGYASLWIFDIYKLGFLTNLKQKYR